MRSLLYLRKDILLHSGSSVEILVVFRGTSDRSELQSSSLKMISDWTGNGGMDDSLDIRKKESAIS